MSKREILSIFIASLVMNLVCRYVGFEYTVITLLVLIWHDVGGSNE